MPSAKLVVVAGIFQTSQCTWSLVVFCNATSGSWKCRTKLWVPAGALVHVRAGETGIGTAWVNLFGIIAPSIQPVVVRVIGAAAAPRGAPPWAAPPGGGVPPPAPSRCAYASANVVASSTAISVVVTRRVLIVRLL